MHKYGFGVPVLPGQDGRSPARIFHEDPEGWRASRRQMGVTMERVYLMPTPMGDFVIAYLEGDKDFGEANQILATSQLDADVKFRDALKQVHGFDFAAAAGAPAPELVADWTKPGVSERKPGWAFIAPLKPGATEAARAFANEAWKTRAADFAASREKLGNTRETVILNQTPQGDMVVVYVEGDDPAESNRRFAASHEAFDVWFKDECRKIFPEFIDFNEPLPPIETIWDKQLTTATV